MFVVGHLPKISVTTHAYSNTSPLLSDPATLLPPIIATFARHPPSLGSRLRVPLGPARPELPHHHPRRTRHRFLLRKCLMQRSLIRSKLLRPHFYEHTYTHNDMSRLSSQNRPLVVVVARGFLPLFIVALHSGSISTTLRALAVHKGRSYLPLETHGLPRRHPHRFPSRLTLPKLFSSLSSLNIYRNPPAVR